MYYDKDYKVPIWMKSVKNIIGTRPRTTSGTREALEVARENVDYCCQ